MLIKILQEETPLQLPDSTQEPFSRKLKNLSKIPSMSLLASQESESSPPRPSNLAGETLSLPTSDSETAHSSKIDLEFLDQTLATICLRLQDIIHSINGLRLDLRQLPDGEDLPRIPGSQQL
ncbi:hypothetical protein LCGC14_0939140 [marine sediment metagenome]|uniref:Uncharacterized protein n=1 Tax=marine sediment metagenome TaxID=412755 RepID=A0A0F9NKK9_9ZZZZ